MSLIHKRLTRLESQHYRFPFCEKLLQIFNGVGPAVAIQLINKNSGLQAFLAPIAEDNIHDLERFRGMVPDEALREAYRSQINRFGDPELQKLIRARAGL